MKSLNLFAAVVVLSTTTAFAQGVGYTDTPQIRGQKWLVHDKNRPNPPVVTSGATFSHGAPAPSDATVLFDGSNLDAWVSDAGTAAEWTIAHGYAQVGGKGGIRTKQEFGDYQLHIEWAPPAEVKGESQGRGNSGVFMHGRFEVQVLDSYNNKSYADGQAGGIYGQWPPLVNPIKQPGEWNSYDIVFEAPHFDADGKLTKPAFVTVFFNGVCVHNRKEINGPTDHRATSPYQAYSGKGPIALQNHGNPTRYRNIWIRSLGEYN